MAEIKEWTLMFYFASDNPLAPGIVSQLKTIKEAGFHPEANVLAHFDPQTEGTPTHIFEVNLINKLENPGKPSIGFVRNDPYVRSLMEDKLWRDETDRHGNSIKGELRKILGAKEIPYDPPEPLSFRRKADRGGNGKEIDPEESLSGFLKFCRENYPARHYMLFILGHGVVVGNDVFLFDEHADKHSLKLTELGNVLRDFSKQIGKDSNFELISLHSCSMSGVEVAYELQGTANYLLASQGPAFVGSWPYRQILIRVFNDLEKYRGKIDIQKMLTRIFSYCLHNSSDFMLAGYSFDLCLCNLTVVKELTEPLQTLSQALIKGLGDPLLKEFILLAHWRSQSYWQESYTDLYDFCFCLNRHCETFKETTGQLSEAMGAVCAAAGGVMDVLAKSPSETSDKLIVRAEFAGPDYQFSHGLSVFFPWSRPSDDTPILEEYQRYKFADTFWFTFLEEYFRETRRQTYKDEPDSRRPGFPKQSAEAELLEDIASLLYNEEGRLSNGNTLSGPKTDPKDPTGDECTCVSIKNFPRDTRPSRVKGQDADPGPFPISPTFFS